MNRPRRPCGGGGLKASVSAAPIAQNPQADQAPPLDAVGTFAPWAGPAERALRLRIHKARDLATARASRSKHGDARLLYWLAAQRAGARVFARVDEDELRETIMELTRLFQTAGSIERRDAPDER